MGAQPRNPSSRAAMKGASCSPSAMITCSIALSSATSRPGGSAAPPREAVETRAARIGTISCAPRARGVLQEGGGDRVVLGRPRADHEDQVGILRRHEGRGDGAAADAFQQRGDGGRVAEPRAVIHVVGAEAGAHQLLEQIGFLVRSLGRAEAGQRIGPDPVADARRPAAARAIASSHVASRNFVRARAGRAVRGSFAAPSIRTSGFVRRSGCAHSRSRSAPSRRAAPGSPARRARPLPRSGRRARGSRPGSRRRNRGRRSRPRCAAPRRDGRRRIHHAFGSSAPVGQACTHSPQPTQLEAPMGSSRSNTATSMPRCARPMTSLCCTSRQARSHRPQAMQASSCTAMAGCE
jgi:hypothetical protein